MSSLRARSHTTTFDAALFSLQLVPLSGRGGGGGGGKGGGYPLGGGGAEGCGSPKNYVAWGSLVQVW